MNQDYPNFQSRVARITNAQRDRVQGEFVLRTDGLLVPRTKRRLRFGFPIKGLTLAFLISIAVKAYLIWFLGADVYQNQVQQLLNGSSLEQVAGRILLPDSVSLWVVTQYEWLYQFVLEYRASMTTAVG